LQAVGLPPLAVFLAAGRYTTTQSNSGKSRSKFIATKTSKSGYMAKETSTEGNNQISISLAELKEKNITDLAKIAKELNIPGASGMRKQELIFQILRALTNASTDT